MRLFFFLLLFFTLRASALNSPEDCSITGCGKPEVIAETTAKTTVTTLTESFENWPPTGWTFLSPDGGKGWSRVETGTSPFPGWSLGTVTAPAGGGKYVAYASLITGGTKSNDQWLISPQVPITTGDSLSFWLTAQGTSMYSDHVEVRISTSGKNVSDFTEKLLVLDFTSGIIYPWKKYKADLAPYAGKSVYIAWRETTTDNRTEGAFIMLDQVRIGPPVLNDVALLDISIPRYSAPVEIPVSGTFLNFGLRMVSQIDINWQVDDWPVHTSRLSGLAVGTDQTFSFVSHEVYTPLPGVHVIKVWISGLNGNPEDENSSNDVVFKMITVGSKGVPKLPLMEEFTSSTCPPCASFNSTVLNPFMETNRVPLIKYQMNWPLPGDRYYNYDGEVRKQFYGVSAVPTLLITGSVSSRSTGAITTAVSNALNSQALIEISAFHQINKNLKKIDIKTFITPYFTESNFKAHIAVVEKKTTGNKGSNGETEFHSVLMKMIPNGIGTDLNLADGIPQTIRSQVDLSGTYIEEFNDLEVIVFVQNSKTKEVFQSAFSEEVEDIALGVTDTEFENLRIFPNPTDGIVTISNSMEFEATVFDASGRPILKTERGALTRHFDLSEFKRGIYLIRIVSDKNIITHKILLR